MIEILRISDTPFKRLKHANLVFSSKSLSAQFTSEERFPPSGPRQGNFSRSRYSGLEQLLDLIG